MAEISKQALKVENNTEFPNNNAGAITPSRLRTFNIDMIDSLVDEISYQIDSASWEQSIAALEAFTGSASGITTGSLLITASANLNTITFTKGNGSTFDVNVNTGSVDLIPLNNFTASIAGTNTFTASIAGTNTFTQSIQTEVDNIQAATASYATTGSNTFVGNQTIVGSVSASSFVSASKFIGDGTQITGITASVATTILDDGILQGTATSLNFTGSGINASVVAGIGIIEVQVDQSVLDRYATTASFNAYTQSTDAKIDSINGFTASVAGTNNFTASIAGTNSFTASLVGTNAFTESANSRLTALENTSASVDVSVSALNGFTASVAGTNAFTASIAGTNAFTESAAVSIAALNSETSSYARLNVNNQFTTDQTISGSLVVTGTITANELHVIIESSSVIFSSGSNILGDELTDTQILSGSVKLVGTAELNGSPLITSAVTSSIAVSSSLYAETASLARNVIISAINDNQSTLPIGTVVRITGATGDNPRFNSASWDNDSTSANTLGILANTAVSGDYADITVIGKVVGVNTDPALGYAAGDVLYLSSSGQFTNVQPQAPVHIVTLGEVLRAQQNNGSIFVNISNGWELNELHNVRIESPQQGDVLVYEASSSLWKNQPSSSFVRIEQTGSFATTGSNAFLGNQTITGSVTISGSAQSDLTVVGQIFVSSSATAAATAPRIIVSGSAGRTIIQRNGITIANTTDEGGMFPSTLYAKDSATFDEIGFTVDASVFGITGWSTGPSIYVNNTVGDTYPAVIGFQNKANYTDGRVAVLTPLSASAGFTASLAEGNIWVGNSLGQNSQIASSSFVKADAFNTFTQSIQAEVDDIQSKTGSYATTGSNVFDGTNTFTVAQTTFDSQVLFTNNADINNYSGSAWTFGLSATTGSNYTLKSNPFEPVLLITRESDNAKPIQMDWRDNKVTLAESGSVDIHPTANLFKVNTTSSFYGRGVWIVADGFTSSLAYVTASVSGSNSNLIFKNNALTTATVVSGSSNIFQSPAAATAGFVRNIGGSHNFLFTSGSIPQISGSMAFTPSFQGNIVMHGSSNSPIILRGPVSSSAYSLNHNILMGGTINYGTSAANSFDKATAGMATQGNALFNGTINVTAPTTPLSSSVNISGNLLFGAAITLNCFSSSITYASNVQNGGITVNNSYVAASGSSAAVLNLRSNVNTIYGVGHALNVSGTNTSTTQGKQFFANIIAGTFLSSSIGTGDNCNILATGVIGNSLIITGSTLTSTFAGPDTANSGQGSLFAGRFNALDGSRALTGETVFAIGTGTSNANRKTGFLIDSGSNTFVEGTFNVSGSSTLNGNTTITGSLTLSSSLDVELNVMGNTNFVGNQTISGSSVYTGSVQGNVVSMSIVSNTASMDFNAGNFFTITLDSGSIPTFINPTNIKAGQTVSLVVTQASTLSGSLAFPTTFKFPSGSAYVPSAVTSSKDIVTFITVDTTTIYASSVKNLI